MHLVYKVGRPVTTHHVIDRLTGGRSTAKLQLSWAPLTQRWVFLNGFYLLLHFMRNLWILSGRRFRKSFHTRFSSPIQQEMFIHSHHSLRGGNWSSDSLKWCSYFFCLLERERARGRKRQRSHNWQIPVFRECVSAAKNNLFKPAQCIRAGDAGYESGTK